MTQLEKRNLARIRRYMKTVTEALGKLGLLVEIPKGDPQEVDWWEALSLVTIARESLNFVRDTVTQVIGELDDSKTSRNDDDDAEDAATKFKAPGGQGGAA